MLAQTTAQASAKSATPLPIYDNAQSWYGPDQSRRTDWIHRFSEPELREIDAAVTATDKTGKDLLEFTAADFPLPIVRPLLKKAKDEILRGRGFYLFRGLPVGRYTHRQSALAYWGMGLHMGEPVSQNAKGHLLGHVTNLGLTYTDPEVRGYQTNARLPYHTDASDIVGLLCLQPSRTGGLSSIVSSTSIWNELVRARPDLASVLLGSFHRTRWGEIPAGQHPWSSSPIFAPCENYVVASYVRSAIRKGQALPGVPQLTDVQNEALDYIDALAAKPELHLDMELQQGDIQMVSNHCIFHSRTAYEDFPEPERRRHLMRLWLACDDGPDIPGAMGERYAITSKGRPGGILVPGVKVNAPIEAV
jgi:hypothetical protein